MEHKNIREAISSAHRLIDAVGKTKANGVSYDVLKFEDLLEAIRQPLVENGIVVSVDALTVLSWEREVIPAKSENNTTNFPRTEFRSVIQGTVRFSHSQSDTYLTTEVAAASVAFNDKFIRIAQTELMKIAFMQVLLVQSEDSQNENTQQRQTAQQKQKPAQKDMEIHTGAYIFSKTVDANLLDRFNKILDDSKTEESEQFKYPSPTVKKNVMKAIYDHIFGGWASQPEFQTIINLMADGHITDPFWNRLHIISQEHPELMMLAAKILS